MVARQIDKLIWKALTDSVVCERLLNGHRREELDAFGLTAEEQQVVLAVQADTLESFAGTLCQPGFCGS
jgi:hypothetical protein